MTGKDLLLKLSVSHSFQRFRKGRLQRRRAAAQEARQQEKLLYGVLYVGPRYVGLSCIDMQAIKLGKIIPGFAFWRARILALAPCDR